MCNPDVADIYLHSLVLYLSCVILTLITLVMVSLTNS